MNERARQEIINLCNIFLYQQLIWNTRLYKLGQYPAPKNNKGGLN